MAKTTRAPRFVNLQDRTVTVYDATTKQIEVHPYNEHERRPGGNYVVEGEHFAQFVSPRGPLYPFPEAAAVATEAAAAEGAGDNDPSKVAGGDGNTTGGGEGDPATKGAAAAAAGAKQGAGGGAAASGAKAGK